MDQNPNTPDQSTQNDNPNQPSDKGSKRWWVWPLIIILAALALNAYQKYRQNAAPTGPGIPWLKDYDQAILKAQQENKLLLVAFSSQGCPPCRRMKQNVYHHPDVLQAAQNFIPVYIDTDQYGILAIQFNIPGTPTFQIHDSSSQILHSFAGYHSPTEFIQQIQHVLPQTPPAANNETP